MSKEVKLPVLKVEKAPNSGWLYKIAIPTNEYIYFDVEEKSIFAKIVRHCNSYDKLKKRVGELERRVETQLCRDCEYWETLVIDKPCCTCFYATGLPNWTPKKARGK